MPKKQTSINAYAITEKEKEGFGLPVYFINHAAAKDAMRSLLFMKEPNTINSYKDIIEL